MHTHSLSSLFQVLPCDCALTPTGLSLHLLYFITLIFTNTRTHTHTHTHIYIYIMSLLFQSDFIVVRIFVKSSSSWWIKDLLSYPCLALSFFCIYVYISYHIYIYIYIHAYTYVNLPSRLLNSTVHPCSRPTWSLFPTYLRNLSVRKIFCSLWLSAVVKEKVPALSCTQATPMLDLTSIPCELPTIPLPPVRSCEKRYRKEDRGEKRKKEGKKGSRKERN